MSFNDAAILVRRRNAPLRSVASMAGLSWKDESGRIVCKLLASQDPNVAIEVHRMVSNGVFEDAALVFVGRYLDRVVKIGNRDYQVFRFHWNVYDDCCDPAEKLHFGEQFAERWNPAEQKTTVLEIEPIFGPRMENQEALKNWALFDKGGRELFIISRTKVVPDRVEPDSWFPHPGISRSLEEFELIQTASQLEYHEARYAQRIQ